MRRTGGAAALPHLRDAGRWIAAPVIWSMAYPLERGSQPEPRTKGKQIG